MTAIQILEKLGVNVSFNPDQLSEVDKLAIQQTLMNTNSFNSIQTLSAEEETPNEDDKES